MAMQIKGSMDKARINAITNANEDTCVSYLERTHLMTTAETTRHLISKVNKKDRVAVSSNTNVCIRTNPPTQYGKPKDSNPKMIIAFLKSTSQRTATGYAPNAALRATRRNNFCKSLSLPIALVVFTAVDSHLWKRRHLQCTVRLAETIRCRNYSSARSVQKLDRRCETSVYTQH